MSIRYQGVTVGGLTEVDGELSSSSTNPVQNKVVTGALAAKADLVNGTVPSAQLPAMDYVPTSRTVNGKALSTNITLTASDVGAIATSEKGSANGVASLDSSTHIPPAQIPALPYLPNPVDVTASSDATLLVEPGKFYNWTPSGNGVIGVAQGVDTTKAWTVYLRITLGSGKSLSGDGVTVATSAYLGQASNAIRLYAAICDGTSITLTMLPRTWEEMNASSDRIGIVARLGNEFYTASNKFCINSANISEIDAASDSHKPIVPSTLNYAVRSVLPNVTIIPAATTAYSLLDASATTNNHSHTYMHVPSAASTYTLPVVTNNTITHEITLDVEFAAYARYSDGDSGSAYAWKHNSDILYTDTTTIVAATTKAYSDTALTTEVGTIALYDSTASAFAMCGSVAFEDANGATIVPKPMEDIDIKPGTVVCYLCRWNSILQCWVIMPTPQENRTVPRPVITISPSSYTVNGNQNSAIASLDLGANTTVANPASGSLSFSSSDLPAGIGISSAGVISGTPTATGTTTSTITIAYPGATSITCTVTFVIAAPAVTYYYTVSGAPNLNKMNLDSDVEDTDISPNGNYSLYSGTHGTANAVYTNGTIYMQLDPREGGGWNLLLEPVSDWEGEMGPNFVGFYMGGTGTTPDTGTWNASNGTPFMPGSADWMYVAAAGSTATVSAYSA